MEILFNVMETMGQVCMALFGILLCVMVCGFAYLANPVFGIAFAALFFCAGLALAAMAAHDALANQ